MKTFSERKGLRPVSETIQIDSMTMELRNSLWNALDSVFWSKPFFVRSPHGIRHAMLNEPNLTAADARYFLVSCSSFVNYLKARTQPSTRRSCDGAIRGGEGESTSAPVTV